MSIINKKPYRIISKEYLADDIVSMWIESGDIAAQAKPGQFVSVYTDSKSELLPRPISICDYDTKKGAIRLVFRIAGKGTAELAAKEPGEYAAVLGPLGNGYADVTADFDSSKRALIIGGGIGIPPMLGLAEHLKADNKVVLGYRDVLFMNEEFEPYGDVYIASEDGKHGTKGNVIDAVKANDIRADAIFACGPMPMLKGIKAYAEENGIPAWVSLEEKMACGIGACLACVCKSTDIDSHSMVHNKRICKDGPVFNVKEVDFS